MKDKKVLLAIIVVIITIGIIITVNKFGKLQDAKKNENKQKFEVEENFLIQLELVKKVELDIEGNGIKLDNTLLDLLNNTKFTTDNPGANSDLSNCYLFKLYDKNNNLIYTVQYDIENSKTFIFDNYKEVKTLYYIKDKKIINYLDKTIKENI